MTQIKYISKKIKINLLLNWIKHAELISDYYVCISNKIFGRKY